MSTTAYKTALGLPMLPPLAATSLGKSADHMMQLIGFHSLYNVPMAPMGSEDPAFQHMTNARVALRLNLIAEEFKELLLDGFGIDATIMFSVPDKANPGNTFRTHDLEDAVNLAEENGCHRNGVEVADASGDMVYVLYGMMLEMGFDLRDVIQEIHGSNLTKLGEDGKPIHREDGKVLKGPNYMKPNISAALGWED